MISSCVWLQELYNSVASAATNLEAVTTSSGELLPLIGVATSLTRARTYSLAASKALIPLVDSSPTPFNNLNKSLTAPTVCLAESLKSSISDGPLPLANIAVLMCSWRAKAIALAELNKVS
eukprot:Lithocolla_globosa_v1_NODE_2357_length_2036_cov_21.163554.p2 type:complete len:121 gc:universal NODE_2357_length_2036_cov_21.163554:964-1326(+)